MCLRQIPNVNETGGAKYVFLKAGDIGGAEPDEGYQ